MNYAATAHPGVHEIPGRALGIWAFVLSFLIPPLALIFGIIAVVQSRRAGVSNSLGIAGIAVSVGLMAAGAITTIAIAATGGFSSN